MLKPKLPTSFYDFNLFYLVAFLLFRCQYLKSCNYAPSSILCFLTRPYRGPEMSSKANHLGTSDCISRNQQTFSPVKEKFSQKSLLPVQADMKLEPSFLSCRDASLRCRRLSCDQSEMQVDKNRKVASRDCTCKVLRTTTVGGQKTSASSGITEKNRRRMSVPAGTLNNSNTTTASNTTTTAAASSKSSCRNSLYGQIIEKKIKANIIYEDEHVKLIFFF